MSMVGTISPVVYGSSRRSLWHRLMGIYVASQIAGAVLTGVIFAAAGAVLQAVFHWNSYGLVATLAVVAVLAGMRDLNLVRYPLPSRNWQVPQSWKRFSPGVMSASYGFGIGLGVVTRIPVASFYFVLLADAGLA